MRLFTALTLASAALAGAPPERLGSALRQAQGAVVFSARSELVVLHVLVTERGRTYAANLPADAFVVFEDGRPQPIKFFEAQDAPVTVGLVVDSSGSMSAARDRIIAAVGAFADTSNPNDELFALTFNERVRPALPATARFTSDARILRTALTDTFITRGRTALYDAIAAGLEYVSHGRHQVKVLVIVSDGGDNASATTFGELLAATQESNTVIYTIAVADPLERDASPKRLERLAEVSGGEAFEPRSVGRVEDVLRRIATDIRHTYTIGYVPVNTTPEGRFRKIRVQVNAPERKGLRVRTRQGYVPEAR